MVPCAMFPYNTNLSPKLFVELSSDVYTVDQLIKLSYPVLDRVSLVLFNTAGSSPPAQIYCKMVDEAARDLFLGKTTPEGIRVAGVGNPPNMQKNSRKGKTTETVNGCKSSPRPVGQTRTPVAKRTGLGGPKGSPLSTQIRVSSSRKRLRSTDPPSASSPDDTPMKSTKRLRTGSNVAALSQSSPSGAAPGPSSHCARNIVDYNAILAPPATPTKQRKGRRIEEPVIKRYENLQGQVLGLSSQITMLQKEKEWLRNAIYDLMRSDRNITKTLSEFVKQLRMGLPFLDGYLSNLKIAHEILTETPPFPADAVTFVQPDLPKKRVEGSDEELESMVGILESELSQSMAEVATDQKVQEESVQKLIQKHDIRQRLDTVTRESISSLGIISETFHEMVDVVV